MSRHASRLPRIAVLLSLMAAAPVAIAAVYHWTDAEGQEHFASQPPPDTQAERMDVRPPKTPAEAAPAQADKRLEQYREEIRADAEKRKERKALEEKAAKIAAERQKNCDAARTNLERLTSGRIRLFDDQGVAYYPTEEERQAKIQEARDNIERYCD